MTGKHAPSDEMLARIRERQQEIVEGVLKGQLDADVVHESLVQIIAGRVANFRFDDSRSTQAWRLYCAGWGRELGYSCFADYLAGVPPLPEWPLAWQRRFDRNVLVDARLPLTAMCQLLDIQFLGDEETFVDFAPEKAKRGIYWMRCQDGKKNHNRSVRECWRSFRRDEVALTAVEGISLYAHEPALLEDHVMVLPGSVLRRRGLIAFLRLVAGSVVMDWIWSGHADPHYGAASRGGEDAGSGSGIRAGLARLWRRWLPRRRR